MGSTAGVFVREIKARTELGQWLAARSSDVPFDLRAALEQAYEAGDYRERIDYSRPCEPPLSADDQAWAAELVRTSAG